MIRNNTEIAKFGIWDSHKNLFGEGFFNKVEKCPLQTVQNMGRGVESKVCAQFCKCTGV